MASVSYLRKRREAISKRAAERGLRGNEVQRRRMRERGADLEVAGTMITSGSFGEHVIELLACDDPTHVWLRVDGELRRPRTCAGVKRVVGDWIWKKGN